VEKGSGARATASRKQGSSGEGAASGEGPVYHQVQKGQNLFRISLKYDVEVEELRRWNDLGKNEPIYPGQKLIVKPGSR
jgi:LysM repeat protein